MYEFNLPVPSLPPTHHGLHTKKRVRQTKQYNHTTLGTFIAVKEWMYNKIALKVQEVQVGVNLFYLVDHGNLVGYRRGYDYHYLKGKKDNGSKRFKEGLPKPPRGGRRKGQKMFSG